MHLLVENLHFVACVSPIAAMADEEDAVSLKGWDHAAVVIQVDNATSVTGSVVTLKQSTAVALTSEKALGFSTVYANIDVAASDTFVKTAVTSDTFTTDTTNNKNLLYVIEIATSSLDVANGFDVLRADFTDLTSGIGSACYLLSRGRYKGGLPRVSAITD